MEMRIQQVLTKYEDIKFKLFYTVMEHLILCDLQFDPYMTHYLHYRLNKYVVSIDLYDN